MQPFWRFIQFLLWYRCKCLHVIYEPHMCLLYMKARAGHHTPFNCITHTGSYRRFPDSTWVLGSTPVAIVRAVSALNHDSVFQSLACNLCRFIWTHFRPFIHSLPMLCAVSSQYTRQHGREANRIWSFVEPDTEA